MADAYIDPSIWILKELRQIFTYCTDIGYKLNYVSNRLISEVLVNILQRNKPLVKNGLQFNDYI